MSTLAKLAAVLALVLLLLGSLYWIDSNGYDRAKAEDRAAISQLKADAANTLTAETHKTRAAEQALQSAVNTQNLKDADHETTVNVLSERLAHLAGPTGRLRDPHGAAGCGSGGGGAQGAAATPAADRAADASETGGLLSGQLSGLLRQLTREADEINTAYASCRADALTVRGLSLN